MQRRISSAILAGAATIALTLGMPASGIASKGGVPHNAKPCKNQEKGKHKGAGHGKKKGAGKGKKCGLK